MSVLEHRDFVSFSLLAARRGEREKEKKKTSEACVFEQAEKGGDILSWTAEKMAGCLQKDKLAGKHEK